MNPSLEALLDLLPPPDRPTPTPIDWDSIEHQVGLRLPEDYKQYVEVYGHGLINDELVVLTPYGTRDYDIVDGSVLTLDADRAAAEYFPPEFPYRFFPEDPGLFPWATTGNGDYCYWLVVDGAATVSSPVVVKETRGGWESVWQFDGGMCRFLTDLLSGRVDVPCLPRHVFTPPRFDPR